MGTTGPRPVDPDVVNIAYHAIRGLSGLKYFYDETIDGAIAAAAHREGIQLTDKLRSEARAIVDKALQNLVDEGRLKRRQK